MLFEAESPYRTDLLKALSSDCGPFPLPEDVRKRVAELEKTRARYALSPPPWRVLGVYVSREDGMGGQSRPFVLDILDHHVHDIRKTAELLVQAAQGRCAGLEDDVSDEQERRDATVALGITKQLESQVVDLLSMVDWAMLVWPHDPRLRGHFVSGTTSSENGEG